MKHNPFPGPQPFQATDRAHFHGREDLSRRLEGAILVHRAVVVHGPSGSGKSSLIQASVLPNLRDAEEVRVVHLDGWPSGENPTHWLSVAMHAELKQGTPPADLSPSEAVLLSLKRAVRGSSRMLVLCIDQLEQLLYSDRDPQETEAFFDCVNDILELPLRTLRIVMSLREDYLGVFRDRLRDHRRVLGQGFRVGPLTVGELSDAMCQTASSGDPPQDWSLDEIRSLMMQARVPGQAETEDAEVQAAYGQIVCRATFQDRASGADIVESKGTRTEAILQKYLETTLTDLGPLREQAERLLEDQLVSGAGGRTLRTERELEIHFQKNDLQTILGALERAAILRAASHQGSRYFEIGHDWLARKVFERRQIREEVETRRRREEEQARVLEKARKERRVYLYVAVVSLIGVVVASVSTVRVSREKRKAEIAEDAANHAAVIAQRREIDARDASILAGVRELSSRGKLTWAMKLLPEVALPAKRRGWVALASDLLASNALQATLEGHTASLTSASFSPDDKHILTSSIDGTARIWDVERDTASVVFSSHSDAITFATWSHDGKSILTTSLDGTARISPANGTGIPLVLTGAKGPVNDAAFSPDDKRVVTASQDGFVRMYQANGKGAPLVEVQASKQAVHCVVFHPDGSRVFFSSHDGSVQSWDGKTNTKPDEIGKHDGPATFLAASSDKVHIVSVSTDGTARIWDIGAKKPRVVTTIQHDGPVNHAAFSPDGRLVATGSVDRMARIIRVDSDDPPFVLPGHTQSVTNVAFHPNGHFLATSSQDGTARIFRVESDASFVLRGHDAAVRTIAWNHKGTMLVTAAGDGTDRSPDETARVWNGAVMQSIGYGSQGAFVDHSAEADGTKKSIVFVQGDEVVRVFHRDTGNRPTVVLPKTGGWIASASLSYDGQLVATASFDKLVRVFSVDNPVDPVVLSGHEAEVRFVAFSRDGTRVLSGGDDSNAFVFSIEGKNPPVKLAGHRDWLTAGAWSPDGKRVVTASFDHTARVWNADGSGAAVELAGHRAEILSVAFFPDGERIATASADFTARIWKPGEDPRILPHDGAVSRVAVSPDGKFVATYAADHLIRIWRVDSTESPIELEASTVVHLLTFENDGQQLVAIDIEGAAHVWMIDPAVLRDRIVKANADCLPKSVRMLYLSESASVAESRFAACTQKPYEMPWINPVDPALLAVDVKTAEGSGAFRMMETPTLKELGPDMIRVKVVVLPTDADVEIDGIATARRQGVIEFVGKVGQTRKLRVQRGAKHRSFDVDIGADGASPMRIDLNDNPTGSIRPGTSDKPGPNPATTANPLEPETME